MAMLADAGHTVLLETSGSLDIARVDPRVVRIVDVKCPGSGEAAKNRWENLAHLRPHDELKFVLAGREDYEWAREQVRSRDLAGRATVLFGPAWGALEPRVAGRVDPRRPPAGPLPAADAQVRLAAGDAGRMSARPAALARHHPTRSRPCASA